MAVNGRSRRRGGGRRAFFLAGAVLLTLGLTFALGVAVGHRWARSQAPRAAGEPARKPAAARRALSDPEAVKPPQIPEKLTFYQTLTAPLGATPPPAKPGAPKAEVRREEASKERPQPASETSSPPEADAPAPERVYTVQVIATRARPAAEELERKLKEAGFEVYVATLTGDDGRTTYRVRVGSFPARPQAEQMAERLRTERGLSPFVTTR